MLPLIRCPFHPPPRLTAVARKIPGSFSHKCRQQVTHKHAYTFDPMKSEWAAYAAIHEQYWNLSENELTHNSFGNAQPQSSPLTEPLWTDPGLKNRISVRELISTLKRKRKRKKAHAGNEGSNFLLKSSQAKKKAKTYPTSSL